MSFRRPAQRDERGAIMVLSTVGIVIAMVAAALAVDLGSLAQDARQDQKVADLAALDGVRSLPSDPTTAVVNSATLNGFECPDTVLSDGCGLTVEWSDSVTGVFTSLQATLPLATAVRVTTTTFHTNDFPFVGGGRSVSRKGTASLGNGTGCYYPDICEQTPGTSGGAVSPIGTVRVGSSLATVTSSESTILNRLLKQTVGGDYSLSALGWEGLADANVSFSRLRTALNASAGSPDGVLDADMKFRRLLNATVDALNADGSPSSITASNFLVNIRNQVGLTAGADLKLRNLFDIVGKVGSGNDVADATLNVKDIVTGGLILADGNNFAAFDLDVGDIPGLPADVTVKFGLIEPPQTKTGPPKTDAGVYRTVARTAQVKLLIELKVDLSLAGGLITLPLTIPYYFDAATATGSLDTIQCSSNDPVPANVKIFGQTDIAKSYIGTVTEPSLATPTASVASTTTLGAVTVNLGVLLGSVGVTAALTGPLATANVAGHSGLRTFTPDYTGETSQTIPGSTTVPVPSLGAGNLTVTLTGLGTTLATLGLTPAVVTGLIVSLITPMVAPLNNSVVAPLTRALGLSLGAGDLWAPPVQTCNPTSYSTGPTSSVGPLTPFGYQIPSLVG